MTEAKHIKPSVEIATLHAAKIRLVDVSCFALRAHVTADSITGTLRYEIETTVVEWHVSGAGMHVLMPLELRMEHQVAEDDERLQIGAVAVTMSLQYSLRNTENPIPTDATPHVLGVNAYMHSWPYFRADVQSLTAKLGLPALTLPVLLSGEVPKKVLVASSPRTLELTAQTASEKRAPIAKRRPRRK